MRSTQAIVVVLFVGVAVVATPTGQEPRTGSLRDDSGVESALRLVATWLDAERAYKQVPGLSVGIVHDQEVVWSHGFGYADRERRVPASAKTLYSICSISKLGSSQRSVQFWSVSMANKSSIVSDLHGCRTPSVSGEELQAPGKSGPQ